jgi:hypothetical protein
MHFTIVMYIIILTACEQSLLNMTIVGLHNDPFVWTISILSRSTLFSKITLPAESQSVIQQNTTNNVLSSSGDCHNGSIP